MAWNRRAKEAIFRRFLHAKEEFFADFVTFLHASLEHFFAIFIVASPTQMSKVPLLFLIVHSAVVDELFARYLKIGRTSWILKIFVVFNYFMHFSESNLILKKIFIKWIFAMLQKAWNKQKVETILIHLVSWVLSKFIVSKNNYILY